MAVHPRTNLSLFSGIGALDLAIGRVFPGIRTVAYLEGEGYAAAVLVARMADGSLDDAPIWSDVRTFPRGALRGRVDLVAGGFPCQDISLAGNGDGITGERSGLFFALAGVVRDVRPRYLFLENVAALTVRGLDAVLGSLADLGFDAEWGCLRASDVGAPHGRNRWWCLAWDREQLADTGGPRRWEDSRGAPGNEGSDAGWSSDGHHQPDGIREELADAEYGRIPERSWSARRASEERPPERRGSRNDSATLADATRLQRPGQRRGLRDGRGVREVLQAVEFPPGPDDHAGWRAYLELYPDHAPATERAIRRGADGAHPRVDRLRALGNAVVPQQAEAALRLLWFRAFGVMP